MDVAPEQEFFGEFRIFNLPCYGEVLRQRFLTVYPEHLVCDLIPDDEILDLSEVPTVTGDCVKTGDSK